jgi:DNA recombination protein RmuC
MEHLPDIFSIVVLVLSAIAALSAFLVLLGLGRKSIADQQAIAAETMASALRTESDRTRLEMAEHSRGLREELGNTIRGFEDSFAKRLDTGIENIRTSISGLSQKLDADIVRMAQEATENRDRLRETIETKLDATDMRFTGSARDLREELTKNFMNTADVLAKSLQSFGESQKEQLGKVERELNVFSERQALAQETLRQTVEGRLDAIRSENSAKLDEMRQTVDEKLQTALEKRLGESFRTVSEQLERVYQGLGEMQTLATGVGDLSKILTNVKSRGTWAEIQLGMLLEQFLSPEQFVKNARVKEESNERVEFAVRFSSRDSEPEMLLPIDAKFPREDYERLVQAAELADAAGVEEATAALVAYVKNCAKSISEKYINPPTTTDFAILYLPTEGLFAEVLRRPGLQEQLQLEYRVTIAGPTTLAAMLNAFQMGFRSLAIQKRSSEVWKLLGAVRGEFSAHGKVVQTLRRQLGAASNTIDKLSTRTNAMNRKLRDVELLPTADGASLLGLNVTLLPEQDEFDDDLDESEAQSTSPGGL